MYLLILKEVVTRTADNEYLHPTMYLLILKDCRINITPFRFTSHYVSINSSADFRTYYHVISHLHPTMYLLIPFHVPPYPTF